MGGGGGSDVMSTSLCAGGGVRMRWGRKREVFKMVSYVILMFTRKKALQC